MKQQSTEKNGLFYAFGRRGLWRDQISPAYQPSENARIAVRYGRGGAQWIRTFCVAG